MFRSRTIMTAIEIGTSKVCALIGSSDTNGDMNILGQGERSLRLASGASSPGAVCKGEVMEMNEVALAITEAVREAEDTAGYSIDRNNLFIAVTGPHIQTTQGRGVVHIRTAERKVTEAYVQQAIEGAMNINLPTNLKEINSFDSYYLLDDDNRRVANPVGQIANKLEAVVHIVYGDVNRIDTTCSALHEIGYDRDVETVFSAIAASYGVLTESEKEEGVLLIDMGAGTTEFLMLQNSGIQASGVLPFGTEHIANDLHVAFGLPIDECRKMAAHRDLFGMLQSKHAVMTIHAKDGRRGERQIPLHSIEKVIELRVQEIITLIQVSLEEELSKQSLCIPVVLTGGGALLPYVTDIVSKIFNAPVRIGVPQNIAGTLSHINSPRYGMICGLLIYGDLYRRIAQNRPNGRVIVDKTLDMFTKPILSFMRNTKKVFKI